MAPATVRVLSPTGLMLRRFLHHDFERGALYVTIGPHDWFVEAAGPAHFRCTRRRLRPTVSHQEATALA